MTQQLSIALNSPFRELVEFVFFCVIVFTVGSIGSYAFFLASIHDIMGWFALHRSFSLERSLIKQPAK